MKNKTLTLFVVLGVIAVIGVSLAVAFPGSFGEVKGSFGGSLTDEEIAEKQAFRESLMEAVESNDYVSWRSLMESQLSEERFNEMREKHTQMQEKRELMQQLREAVEDGDAETAEQLREELSDLGFNRGFNGKHHGLWNHKFSFHK